MKKIMIRTTESGSGSTDILHMQLHILVYIFISQRLWHSNLLIMSVEILSVPDEGYSRNTLYALKSISTFLLLSLGRYLYWWTTSISPCGYHPPSSQVYVTFADFVYLI